MVIPVPESLALHGASSSDDTACVERLRVGLHLGVHKTASTHLQNTLSSGREALRHRGLSYLGPSDIRRGRTGLQEILQGGGATLVRRRLLRATGGCGRLLASDENLIGTMEANFLDETDAPGIYRDAAQRLDRLVSGLGLSDVHLFIALRDPAAYYASCYRFHIQRRGFVTWTDYRARQGLRAVSWVGLVRALRAVPGVTGMTVWRAEDYPAVGPRVLARMLGPDAGPLPLAKGRANPGIGGDEVRRLYRKAGLAPDFAGPGFRPFDRAALARSARRYDREVTRIGGMAGVEVLRP